MTSSPFCGQDRACYSDFKLFRRPPDAFQTTTVQQPHSTRLMSPPAQSPHEPGSRLRWGSMPPADGLLMIQGPLLPNCSNRKLGNLPRLKLLSPRQSPPERPADDGSLKTLVPCGRFGHVAARTGCSSNCTRMARKRKMPNAARETDAPAFQTKFEGLLPSFHPLAAILLTLTRLEYGLSFCTVLNLYNSSLPTTLLLLSSLNCLISRFSFASPSPADPLFHRSSPLSDCE